MLQYELLNIDSTKSQKRWPLRKWFYPFKEIGWSRSNVEKFLEAGICLMAKLYSRLIFCDLLIGRPQQNIQVQKEKRQNRPGMENLIWDESTLDKFNLRPIPNFSMDKNYSHIVSNDISKRSKVLKSSFKFELDVLEF